MTNKSAWNRDDNGVATLYRGDSTNDALPPLRRLDSIGSPPGASARIRNRRNSAWLLASTEGRSSAREGRMTTSLAEIARCHIGADGIEIEETPL